MILNIYYFIDKFNKNEIEKLSSKISLIYRNYGKKSDSIELKKLILYCKSKRRKVYISNNLKIAIKLNLNNGFKLIIRICNYKFEIKLR